MTNSRPELKVSSKHQGLGLLFTPFMSFMILGSTAFLLLSWIISLASLIVFYADQHDPYPADAAIVLGAAVAQEVPTPVFAARIDHAIRLYQSGQVKQILLTGGVGAGDKLAESEAARQYCLDRGIPASVMQLEKRSRTTRENLLFLKPLIRPGKRLLIVTDPLHSLRSVSMARKLGYNAYPAPTSTSRYQTWQSQLPFLFREVWFYALTFFDSTEISQLSSFN